MFYKILSVSLCFLIVLNAVLLISADEINNDNESIIDYPYKVYDNSNEIKDRIIKPDIKYPANSKAVDETTISAAQMVSLNDLSGSYYKYNIKDTKKQPWSGAVNSAYTVVDWRMFNSTIKDNIYDVFRIADDNNGLIVQKSKFNADEETKRAINILGNRAFIPENIDIDSGVSYIGEITLDSKINKTEALTAIYKAVGVEFYMPPLISYGNLDGQIISKKETGEKEIRYTSLASLEEAEKYSFYAVAARNARNYVYQSPNLVEGYLWQGLQDGIISYEHLTENALKYLSKYQKGEYSQPISRVKKLKDIASQESLDNRFSLAYAVGINKDDENNSSSLEHFIARYQQPEAFKYEAISLIDFCVLVSQVMHIQGEPVITESEQKTLTAIYASSLPSTMSAEYYDTILYLVARGIIDNSYTPERLYKPLTWKDMYIILSRVADKNSRLTYKNITIPYDLEMAEDGFISLKPQITELKPIDIENSIEDGTYKDIFLKKDSNTTFIDKNGKELSPFLSKQFNLPTPSYGILMDNNFKDSYYWFRIYYSVPVPSCYKPIYDISYNNINKTDIIKLLSTGQEIHCYCVVSDSSSKILYLENTNINNGIYEYYPEDGVCKYNGYMIEPTELVTLSGIDGITLTGEEEKKEQSQENILYTFKLKNGVELDNIIINGLKKNQWIECENLSIKDKLTPPTGIDKCSAVWVDYNDRDGNVKFALYVEGNTPDNYEAVISSKIQYLSDYESNNYVAYIKRNSSRDVYYSAGFLKSELGAVLSLNKNGNGYILQMPDEKIIIDYKNTGGWLCYSGNSLIRFNSTIPAIKELDREDTTDRYLIHGLIIEYYLRSNFGKGWSSYIGTDGYLHISSAINNDEMTFKNINAGVYNFLTPTDGINYFSGGRKNSPVYKYEKNGTYWLDVRAVPSPLSNYIVFWDIGGTTEAKAGLISFKPILDDVRADTDILSNLLFFSSIKITQSEKWGLEYINGMKFGSNFEKGSDDTTMVNGWTLSNLLRYDDKTFSFMYQIQDTNEISLDNGFNNLYKYKSDFSNSIKWRLPYVYEKSLNRVWFMNLPLTCHFNVYKSDLNIAINKTIQTNIKNSWLDKVLNACIDDNEDYKTSERYWYPVMPLADLFTEDITGDISLEKTSFADFFLKYIGLESDNESVLIAGPYQLCVLNQNSETIDLLVNKSDKNNYIPVWACNIYNSNTNNNKISSKAKVYSAKIGATNIFLPAKNTLDFGGKAVDFEDISGMAVKLNTSFVESLKDIIDAVYLEEKELNNKFKNANSIISLMYLFAVVILPRILFGFLFTFQILALLVKVKFVRMFCDKVFDIYRFLTFGRISYNMIEPVKLWFTGSIGSILIILISRDYGSYIIAKIINVILYFLGNLG